MWANRALSVALASITWLVIPFQILTTFVLGILASITFGLLLIPISGIWMICFLGPLLGLSWLWDKAPLLRLPLSVAGIPLALVGNIYVCLMPSMGELDSRISKLMLTQSWPYSLECWLLIKSKSLPRKEGAEDLRVIITALSRSAPYREFLIGQGITDTDNRLHYGDLP